MVRFRHSDSAPYAKGILSSDPTFFPDRAAKIFYRPPTDKNAQSAGLIDGGAAADNDLPTTVDPSETTPTKSAVDASALQSQETGEKPKVTSALSNLKEKLMSALPSTNDTKGGSSVSRDVEIGIMGIIHPTCLQKFELEYPCSVFEFTVENL